jgi:polyisoprenoid-binding protein YceI
VPFVAGRCRGRSRRGCAGKDFFEVARYPTFVYTVSAARVAADDAVTFAGTLTVHGQTRPLEVRSTAASGG